MPALNGDVFAVRGTSPQSREIGRSTAITEGGSFRMSLPSSGLWSLQASAPGVGVGTLIGIEIDWEFPPQDLILRLTGGGVLAGRLEDPNGVPIAHHSLWAVPVGRTVEGSGRKRRYALAKEQWSGGCFEGFARTDLMGRFRFEGLQERGYDIRGRRMSSSKSSHRDLLAPVPMETGSDDIVLQLPLYRLVVSLRGMGANAAKSGVYFAPSWRVLDEMLIYAHESIAGKIQSDRWARHEGHWTPLGDNSYSRWVEPGQSFVVGVVSPGHALREREVTINPALYRTDVAFEFGEAQKPGRLSVEFLKPDGGPLAASEFNTSSLLQILGPSGKVLFAPEYESGSTHRITLAPGVYRCIGSAPVVLGEFGRESDRSFLPVEFEVEVSPGSETKRKVRLGSGSWAQLNVSLGGAPGGDRGDVPRDIYDLEVEAFARANAIDELVNDSDELPEEAIIEEIEPRPRSPHIVFQLIPSGGKQAVQVGHDWVPVGEPSRIMDTVPPGNYDLWLWCVGYQTQRIPITLKAGDVLDVNATLIPNE
ncbi:MAG: hypothetical protein ACI8QS_001691 [Planctomycetota bacterium]|jgi:hypothetical protein